MLGIHSANKITNEHYLIDYIFNYISYYTLTVLTVDESCPCLLPLLLSLDNDLCLSKTTGQIAVGGRI